MRSQETCQGLRIMQYMSLQFERHAVQVCRGPCSLNMKIDLRLRTRKCSR